MANNQSVRRHLDAFTRGRIIGKLEEGRSVAAEFGIAHSIVSRLWRQFQTTGTAIRGFSSGRPRGTTPADDRYIVLQARRNRRQTVGEIARHTTQATGRPISRFTVARRLHGGGLYDESRFSLSSDSHRILIWRERGSRNHPSNIIEKDRYGGRGVLVWGGIMLGSRTDLHIFDAAMSRKKQQSTFDQVSEFDRGRIVAYRDCGLSFREIGSRVRRNQTTVMRICERWMQEGTTD
ncbi:transposable element Tcb1 transposase [Trichonephila clavipes]|nr:transposable element Tcb1 transposase [Trichonephila clavipes]